MSATVVVNGMILDGLLDIGSGVSTLDGFSADNGEDTQMMAEDREILRELYTAMNEDWGKDLPMSAKYLRRVVGNWSQQPTTLDSTRLVIGEEGRDINMECGWVNCGYGVRSGSCAYYSWYTGHPDHTYANHDGWGHDNHDSDAQGRVQVGDHYSCSGDSWYWTSSGWVCGEPDHWSRPYQVGNCYGRCGGGCGGDTQYTEHAIDHDQCVRGGHSLASTWCNDEFTSASDDELGAPDCY